MTELIAAARSSGSFLAVATDLGAPARYLLDKGLVAQTPDALTAVPSLLALSETADRVTLKAIARLMLTRSPPPWLRIAVTTAGVERGYIPRDDLAGLMWLEPELDELLLSVHAAVTVAEQDALRKKMGDAAELLVFAALSRSGGQPIHVAKMSDSYGYDIETRSPSVSRIEVKAAGETTRGTFHLSRNEFDMSRTYGQQWTLVQVTFGSQAHIAKVLDCSHVVDIRRLDSAAIAAAVPADTPNFKWTESAILRPAKTAWEPARITLDPRFATPGFAFSAE